MSQDRLGNILPVTFVLLRVKQRLKNDTILHQSQLVQYSCYLITKLLNWSYSLCVRPSGRSAKGTADQRAAQTLDNLQD